MWVISLWVLSFGTLGYPSSGMKKDMQTRDFTCIQCVFEHHDKCLKVFKTKGVEGIKDNDYINICDCCE